VILSKSVVLHKFKGNYSAQEIQEIGYRYIRKAFVRHDIFGKVAPFCHTADGIPVFYKSTFYKLICREDISTAYRVVESSRVQRLNWIVPIISGVAKNIKMKDDGTKRRYFIKHLKYLIVLDRDKDGFRLVSAYWVTEQWEMDRIRRQMK